MGHTNQIASFKFERRKKKALRDPPGPTLDTLRSFFKPIYTKSTNWSTTETRLHKFRDLRAEQKAGRLNRLPKRDAAMLKRQLSHLQAFTG